MDEKDLNRLQSLDVPEPSEDAKRRAIAASVAAFEAAGEKTFAETQGSEPAARLMPTFMEATWEWIMERRMLMGTVAASLLVVPFAANLIATDGGVSSRFGEQEVPKVEAPRPVLGSDEQPLDKAAKQKKAEKAAGERNEQFEAEPSAPTQSDNNDQTVTFPPGTPIDDSSQLTHGRSTEADGALADRTAEEQTSTRRVVTAKPSPRAKPKPEPAAPPRDSEVEDRALTFNQAPVTSENKPAASSNGVFRNFAAPSSGPSKKDQARTRRMAREIAPSAADARNGLAGAAQATRRQDSNTLNLFSEIRPWPQQQPLRPQVEENRDRFQTAETNPVKSVKQEPVSTFSIDVDTASYAFVRRTLENGALPRRDAVRVEEMINYFSYDYPRPANAETPFRPSIAVYPTPWNQDTLLMHVGIKGHDIVTDEKPRSNLVFLIDVSGSMQAKDKLPLLKSAFRLLVNRLDPEDTVAIVTYAGRAGTVLEPTKVSDKYKILSALDRLRSGGSTAGAAGIRQAYALAQSRFNKDGVNRVILATDGDFNVGISNVDELKRYIEKKRKSGVFLSVLGFGQGNYNDHLMQVLAQNGNGNAAYIDNLREAQKVLVEEAGSTLFPIAKDVKLQIEFNPALVREYRLIGYETRALKREDFNNDRVDAGDIGSGHTVTAIYELTPVGSPAQLADELRYQKAETETQAEVQADSVPATEYAFLKLRYKRPKENKSNLLTVPVTKELLRANVKDLSDDMRFAAAVAAFAQKLRDVPQVEDMSFDAILKLASGARGEDRFGYRGEFLTLVRLAKSLAGSAAQE